MTSLPPSDYRVAEIVLAPAGCAVRPTLKYTGIVEFLQQTMPLILIDGVDRGCARHRLDSSEAG
jgi:hypothetical protein